MHRGCTKLATKTTTKWHQDHRRPGPPQIRRMLHPAKTHESTGEITPHRPQNMTARVAAPRRHEGTWDRNRHNQSAQIVPNAEVADNADPVLGRKKFNSGGGPRRNASNADHAVDCQKDKLKRSCTANGRSHSPNPTVSRFSSHIDGRLSAPKLPPKRGNSKTAHTHSQWAHTHNRDDQRRQHRSRRVLGVAACRAPKRSKHRKRAQTLGSVAVRSTTPSRETEN